MNKLEQKLLKRLDDLLDNYWDQKRHLEVAEREYKRELASFERLKNLIQEVKQDLAYMKQEVDET